MSYSLSLLLMESVSTGEAPSRGIVIDFSVQTLSLHALRAAINRACTPIYYLVLGMPYLQCAYMQCPDRGMASQGAYWNERKGARVP